MISALKYGYAIEDRVLKLFLKKASPFYKLLYKNYRTPFRYELDIVLLENNSTIVFIEVRYRRKKNWLDGAAESVNWKKMKNLQVAVEWFLSQHPQFKNYPVRIDLVAAEPERTSKKIKFNHIRNISMI